MEIRGEIEGPVRISLSTSDLQPAQLGDVFAFHSEPRTAEPQRSTQMCQFL